MTRKEIFKAIERERSRQDILHPCPTGEVLDSWVMNAVLVEEVGEVSKALLEYGNLAEELIQTASVCVRWLESLGEVDVNSG